MRAGQPVLGAFVNLGSALAAEACALGGVDWLVFDLEHGGTGEEALLPQLLAAEAHGVAGLVRVETPERIRAGRVLDLGARGVMFPRIDTAEQAAEAIAHLRYPPDGDRGVATYNRACGFGLDLGALDQANDEILGIVQIESPEAVRNVAEIAALPGVHVVFVGPRDLSHAMGIPGQFDHPEFRAALAQVVQAAQAAGIAAGILAGNATAAARFADDGFTFVGVGSDSSILAGAVAETVRTTAERMGDRAAQRQEESA
jgi:2-dehydro-3-deoxyglucarate aldolase/4-hydroxy-2-oxoheptanedioate aldolase